MDRFHSRFAAIAWLALSFSGIAAASQDPPHVPAANNGSSGAHDFDFQFGEWRVHHRVLKPGASQWSEFDGTSEARKVMAGAGNVEDNVFDTPNGRYRAVGLRAYDEASGQWSIWWLDGRSPTGPLDPPVRGRFEDGVGRFYSNDTLNGKPIRTRYTWSGITPKSAHREQAYSTDAGKTWETNWIMEFERIR